MSLSILLVCEKFGGNQVWLLGMERLDLSQGNALIDVTSGHGAFKSHVIIS